MTPLSIIIPVRSLEAGKTRLASHLCARERAGLVERMFRHVLDVATQCVPAAHVHVVSRSPALLALAEANGATSVPEKGCEHNSALVQASGVVDQAAPLLVLSADLPLVGKADIDAMVAALETADVVAATDRPGTGTNALLLRQPGMIDYAFGVGSLVKHGAAAGEKRLRFAVIRREGLMADVDEPADLALLEVAGRR